MKFRFMSPVGKILAIITVISLASCQKNNPVTTSADSNAATLSDSSTVADNSYTDVLNYAFVSTADNVNVWTANNVHSGNTVINNTGAVNITHLGCAIYHFDDTIPGSYPKTLTLDFGTGCTSADGIVRKGKIIYVFTGPILFPGDSATVTFDQYNVNGYGLQGAYLIANTSNNTVGVQYTTQVTNGIITYPDASNYHYSHHRVITQTTGMSTPFDLSDDAFTISGNSSFSSSAGNSLVCNTTTPLVKTFVCPHISAGVIAFTYNQSLNGTIDFGNGTCDNIATLIVGNIHKTITLR